MERLRQRLNPEFLVNKTNIFESLTPEDRARVFAELKAYWNDWIEMDLNDLFEYKEKSIMRTHGPNFEWRQYPVYRPKPKNK